MIFALCFLFNLLVVAYFGVTKRKLLAAFYAVALCLVTALILFPFDTVEGVAFWASIFGDEVREYAPFIADFCTQDALSPLAGLQLMSLVLAVVFSLKTVERVHERCVRRSSRLYDEARKPRRDPPARRVDEETPRPKYYLAFCSFLC